MISQAESISKGYRSLLDSWSYLNFLETVWVPSCSPRIFIDNTVREGSKKLFVKIIGCFAVSVQISRKCVHVY